MIAVLTAVAIIGLSCKKTVDAFGEQHDKYYKKFNCETDLNNYYVSDMDDGSILMAGIRQSAYYHFIISDKRGNELRRFEFKKKRLDTVVRAHLLYGLKLSTGEFVFTTYNSTDLIFLNAKGELIKYFNITSSLDWGGFRFSPPIEGDDGLVYFSGSGGGSGTYDENYLFKLDRNGNYLGNTYLLDKDIGGKVLSFCVNRVSNGVYYVAGNMYSKSNWSWNDPQKLYVASFGSGGITKNVFDISDSKSYNLNYSVSDSDNTRIILTGYKFWNSKTTVATSSEFVLYKVDNKSNLVWRKTISFNEKRVQPVKIVKDLDGNLTILGFADNSGTSISRPFFIRINSDGEVLLRKVFNSSFQTMIYDGRNISTNEYVFTGGTLGFAGGKEAWDPILMKLDNSYNYIP